MRPLPPNVSQGTAQLAAAAPAPLRAHQPHAAGHLRTAADGADGLERRGATDTTCLGPVKMLKVKVEIGGTLATSEKLEDTVVM